GAPRRAAPPEDAADPVPPRPVAEAGPGPGAGDRYGSKAYYHAVARSCARAVVPRWHPHQLRHSAATRFRKEFGLDVARTVLGHASPVVTEVYAERDVERALGAVAEVG